MRQNYQWIKDKRLLKQISFALKGIGFIVGLAIFAVFWVFYITTVAPYNEKIAQEKAQLLAQQQQAIDDAPIKNGIHVATGFINDEGLDLVVATCTACHSAKLVTQNRATHEGWTQMIKWMQETQNLWDLGDKEAVIVNYLAKNYAPKRVGRRTALTNTTWYELDLNKK